MPEGMVLTIGELAERSGATLRTLRFYESRGLLAPERQGNVRLYEADQVARLNRILAFKRMGFSVREIEGLMSVGPDAALTPERRTGQITHLERQRDEIDAALVELRAMLPRS